MNDEQMHTLAQLQAFLDGTTAIAFAVAADERYDFIARTIRRFGYGRLKRADKAVVLRFLERVSGYSRQQITRLVKRGSERCKLIKRYQGSRTSFARTYTGSDVLLRAHTDTLHGTLSGLALNTDKPNDDQVKLLAHGTENLVWRAWHGMRWAGGWGRRSIRGDSIPYRRTTSPMRQRSSML